MRRRAIGKFSRRTGAASRTSTKKISAIGNGRAIESAQSFGSDSARVRMCAECGALSPNQAGLARSADRQARPDRGGVTAGTSLRTISQSYRVSRSAIQRHQQNEQVHRVTVSGRQRVQTETGGCQCRHGAAASNCEDTWNNVVSAPNLAPSITPSGSPVAFQYRGNVIAGLPVAL